MKNRTKLKVLSALNVAMLLFQFLPLSLIGGPPGTVYAAPIPNGLSISKSVNKNVVYPDFPEDRKIDYEIVVENTVACSEAPLDIMLVLDRSGSMDDDSYCVGNGSTSEFWCEWFGGTWVDDPLQSAKNSAKDFVDLLNPARDKVGLVSYSTNATLDHALSDDYVSVKADIEAMSADGWTNIGQGLELARGELNANGRTDAVPVIILLTDGIANVNESGTGTPDETGGEAYAQNQASLADAEGTRVIVIGLGDGVNEECLRDNIATSPSDYYYAPTGGDLAAIYASIQATLGDSIDTVVTDDISAMLSYVEFFDADMGGTFNPGTGVVTWDLGTLYCMNDRGASGATVHFSVVVKGDAPKGTVLDNMANVSNLAGASVNSNHVFTTVMGLEKYDTTDPVSPGDIFGYEIEWAVGQYSVSDVEIVDLLDPHVNFVGANLGGVYDGGSHTVTWHLGPQSAYAHGDVNLAVEVENPWTGNGFIYNEASIQLHYATPIQLLYQFEETVGGPVWVDETTDVNAAPLLHIEKIDLEDPVEAGGTLEYQIHVWNDPSANAIAHDVHVTETYDTDVTFVDAIPYPTSGDNYWALGDLAPGEDVYIEITVQLAPGLLEGIILFNQVCTGSTELEDICVTEETEVNAEIILELTKVDNPDPVEPGAELTYTLTLENTGNMYAQNVILTETYDPNVTFVSATPAPDGGTDNVWTIGDMQPGDVFSVEITVDVAEPLADETILENYARADYTDPSTENGTLFVEVTEDTLVTAGPVLDITKTNNAPAAGVNPGGTVTFTITVTNNGNDVADDVTLVDTLPGNVTYVAGSSTLNGSPSTEPTGTNPLTWILGDLAIGETAIVTYQVTVNADAVAGAYSNLSFAEAEEDPTDDTDNVLSAEVTSTFTVVVGTVLGEETEGDVLGASGQAIIGGLLLGTAVLVGSGLVIRKKNRK